MFKETQEQMQKRLSSPEGQRRTAEILGPMMAQQNRQAPVRSRKKKIGRNDPCPCGSGHKFKKCHLKQAVHA